MAKPWRVVGAQLGEGAQIIGTKEGPLYCQTQGLITALTQDGIEDISWFETLVADTSKPTRLDIVQDLCHRLAHTTAYLKAQHQYPVVIGGDHSIAIGTWSGVVSALQAEGQFGLIWIDAHMDAHTFQTTPSHAIHGMPVAALLGHGDARLTQIASPIPKISPAHLVLIGVRSYEAEEAQLLTDKQVKIFLCDEVHDKGFADVWEEALDYLTRQVSYFGISIDLDAFDPTIAPGVGSPEKDGLFPAEVLPVIAGIGKDPRCQAIEITEFNPARDKANQTYELLERLLSNLLM